MSSSGADMSNAGISGEDTFGGSAFATGGVLSATVAVEGVSFFSFPTSSLFGRNLPSDARGLSSFGAAFGSSAFVEVSSPIALRCNRSNSSI